MSSDDRDTPENANPVTGAQASKVNEVLVSRPVVDPSSQPPLEREVLREWSGVSVRSVLDALALEEGAHKLREQAKENDENRRRARIDHVVGIVRHSLGTLAGIGLLAIVLWYSAARIMDPNTPEAAKLFASGFWGLVISKALDFLLPKK